MERLSLKLVQDHERPIEDFCEDCRLRGMTSESIRRYKSSLLIFAGFILNRAADASNVDTQMLKEGEAQDCWELFLRTVSLLRLPSFWRVGQRQPCVALPSGRGI